MGAFTVTPRIVYQDGFKSRSTGVFGYPIEPAAAVAVKAVRRAAQEFSAIQEVVFCCFSASDLAVYTRHLREIES